MIPNDIVQLWELVDDIWEHKQFESGFGSYASADYVEVYKALAKLQGKVSTFLELGSGLGVVTIMASRLGFQAYGIEAEPNLVGYARDFAATFGPNSEFVVGSFIPDEFEWDPGQGDEAVRTFIDLPDAYDELDLTLEDFDLFYAYPWPTEHALYQNVLGQFAKPGSTFLTYDAREGIQISPV